MNTRKATIAKKATGKKPAKQAAEAPPLATDISAESKMSQLQAAIAVLKKARKPMSCKEMVEAMATQNLWSSPGSKTPHATLYSAILRDLRNGPEQVPKGRPRPIHASWEVGDAPHGQAKFRRASDL